MLYALGDGEDTGTLVKSADMAMYEVKSKEKNHNALVHRRNEGQAADEAIYALRKNELSVVYQPQMCSKTDHAVSDEALLQMETYRIRGHTVRCIHRV
ncbi:hypothetical protein [Sporolactobacillus nakayamae]|uniref:Uncharacterized protein n=1 Tax=Sporolactobacillus nakayamae TaxID=269670 RepID=A0A1I2W3Y8_9BACL|nr:hypothetical protein [Sporolactobacillus nakayamae]SFG95369.1 hypothetical protein SAMN02982927_03353 [Sporolactobacillus nakayamae]